MHLLCHSPSMSEQAHGTHNRFPRQVQRAATTAVARAADEQKTETVVVRAGAIEGMKELMPHVAEHGDAAHATLPVLRMKDGG